MHSPKFSPSSSPSFIEQHRLYVASFRLLSAGLIESLPLSERSAGTLLLQRLFNAIQDANESGVTPESALTLLEFTLSEFRTITELVDEELESRQEAA